MKSARADFLREWKIVEQFTVGGESWDVLCFWQAYCATANVCYNMFMVAKRQLEEAPVRANEISVGLEGTKDNEVDGLSTVIRENLVNTVEAHENQLEAHQVEWVRKEIEARYERSRLVNKPLLETEGVPAFPSMEAVMKSALKQLTREQVVYMMEEDRPAFSFQIKLVTPSNRLDLQKKLIDDQSMKMDTHNLKRVKMTWTKTAEQHLTRVPSAEKMEWKWEFIQSAQLFEEPQKGDDASLVLEDRIKQMSLSRPKGMRGVDRYSWAALMADSLEQGRPLDWVENSGLFSLLDEEGGLPEPKGWGPVKNLRELIGGIFHLRAKEVELSTPMNCMRTRETWLRSSVSGSVEAY